ncbi:MAG: alpha/beta fold hydrolase [Frankia sp.]
MATSSTTTTGSATSPDGTRIGFHYVGAGPALVIVHGAMQSGLSQVELAQALSDTFTCYLPDRRGRGLSGPYPGQYNVEQEVADVGAVLEATGAHTVMGVSTGAIIALEAALRLPAVQRVIAFEPPLFADQETARATLTRFDRQLADGRLAAAMVTGMKGAQLGPALFRALPDRLLEWLTTLGMKQDAKRAGADRVPMQELGPLLHYDFRLVADASGSLERYRGVRHPVLLLGGSQSPRYLRDALGELERVLPHHERAEIPGADHGVTGNAAERGKPRRVAPVVHRFLDPPSPAPRPSPAPVAEHGDAGAAR